MFFDRPLPAEYSSLLDGRAVACGPDDADLAGADAVIAGVSRFWDADEFAKAGRLQVISRTGVGYDNIDVGAANAAGVVTCYAPDGPMVSTAEHTITLMMAITKRMRALHADALAGKGGGPALGFELDGRVLGLIGYGRIAKRVAAVGTALGMDVIAYDPLVPALGPTGVRMVSLETLWATSDVISLHAPSIAETRHVVNASSLRLVKRGVFLVNCARGSLVDQDALLDALNDGTVAGAGLDVTDPEPLPAGHPLLTHPNVLITPHMASSTVAGRRRLYERAIDNALAVLDGRPATRVPECTVWQDRGDGDPS